MSNTPGISPITPDLEEVRHSDEDGFFGGEDDGSSPGGETEDDDGEHRDVNERQARTFNP